MNMFVKLRDLFIRFKVYMSRASGYIGLVNTVMILFLFLSNLERYGIDVRIGDWLVPLFILGLFGMLLFGYLEDRLGFFSQEQRTMQSRSPYFTEINKRLENIEQKLDKLKK